MAKHTETPRSGHPIEALLCEVLADLESGADLPAWSMDPETTTRVVQLAARASAALAEVEARAASHAQSLDLPGTAGCKSTQRWLQNTTHVTRTVANAKVALATALDRAETTRAAMTRGDVHAEQALVIAGCLERLDTEHVPPAQQDSAEAFLVEHAAVHNAHDLTRLADAIWERLDPSGWEAREAALLEAQEERARAKTSFTMRDDGDGMVHGRFTIPTLAGAMLTKQLHALAAPKHVRATQGAGTYDWQRPSPRKQGEAFVEWIERLKPQHLGKIGGLNATVIAIGDYDTLTGRVKAASLDTGQKISPTEYLRLACAAEIIPIWMNANGEVLAVGRKNRFHTETQRLTAIVERRHCEHDSGCDTPAHLCHLHHVTPWSAGGETTLRDAQLLCPFHHRHVHTTQRTHPLRTWGSRWKPVVAPADACGGAGRRPGSRPRRPFSIEWWHTRPGRTSNRWHRPSSSGSRPTCSRDSPPDRRPPRAAGQHHGRWHPSGRGSRPGHDYVRGRTARSLRAMLPPSTAHTTRGVVTWDHRPRAPGARTSVGKAWEWGCTTPHRPHRRPGRGRRSCSS